MAELNAATNLLFPEELQSPILLFLLHVLLTVATLLVLWGQKAAQSRTWTTTRMLRGCSRTGEVWPD